MNSRIISAAIIVVCVGAISHFFYWHSYNQAKDAISLMAPDIMLVYRDWSTNGNR
jgi:hypothetical protein